MTFTPISNWAVHYSCRKDGRPYDVYLPIVGAQIDNETEAGEGVVLDQAGNVVPIRHAVEHAESWQVFLNDPQGDS